jgi:hypothetical protein
MLSLLEAGSKPSYEFLQLREYEAFEQWKEAIRCAAGVKAAPSEGDSYAMRGAPPTGGVGLDACENCGGYNVLFARMPSGRSRLVAAAR